MYFVFLCVEVQSLKRCQVFALLSFKGNWEGDFDIVHFKNIVQDRLLPPSMEEYMVVVSAVEEQVLTSEPTENLHLANLCFEVLEALVYRINYAYGMGITVDETHYEPTWLELNKKFLRSRSIALFKREQRWCGFHQEWHVNLRTVRKVLVGDSPEG